MKIAVFNADGSWFTNSIKGDDDWTPPAGMIAVEGVEGKPGDRWDGTQIVSPFVTDADVNSERDRRTNAGFAYSGKVIQFDSDSQANILGACQMAALGILPQPFMWITSDNSLISLTPQQVIEMGAVGAAHKQQMIFAARALKDMDPTPADYDDDTWWQA